MTPVTYEPHLAELAGHRRVFRAGTGGAAHREVADFGTDVELQVPAAQLLGDIDVQRPRFGGDRVGTDLKDTVHRLHLDEGAAVRNATPGGRVVRIRPLAPGRETGPDR